MKIICALNKDIYKICTHHCWNTKVIFCYLQQNMSKFKTRPEQYWTGQRLLAYKIIL